MTRLPVHRVRVGGDCRTCPIRTLTGVRIDLTVRDADDVERDVAITAPVGTTFGDVGELLANLLGGTRPGWIGARALTDSTELGKAPLVSGAICSTAPGE